MVAANIAPVKGQQNQVLQALQGLIAAGQQSNAGQVAWFAVKTAPAGYLKCNGLTIGKPGSGATARENADVLALYVALWNDWSNDILAIQTSGGAPTGRGPSAQADWDALKRLPLPEIRGEGIRAWDDGRGVDAGRQFGSWQSGQIESHSHNASSGGAGTHSHSGSAAEAGSHNHLEGHSIKSDMVAQYGTGGVAASGSERTGSNQIGQAYTSTDGVHSHSLTILAAGDHSHTISVGNTGGNETRMRNIALSAFIRYL
ncbi:hypothetical protein ACFSVK_07680 [Azorhizophilus paspali]|uniref:hypothetical protein n=1 Tax=Azorhizophilus paspali TaxID=69963 RepID=UPI0036425D94